MQRYVRLFGTPVTLLLLLAILLYGAWWGKKNLLAPIPTPAPTPCATQTVGKSLATSQVTVRVLNASSHVGMAGQVGSQLTNAGFILKGVGNASATSATTQVIGASTSDPEVKLVLGFMKGATAKGDGRVDHTVDVLVGKSYGGVNASAPRSVAVPNGTVCLPAAPASTGS